MSPSTRSNRSRASVSALVCPLVLVLALALPGSAVMVGSSHDFVDNGYEGGVCDECHVPHYADATAGRLYPRPASGTLPARLCMDCHDGVMPAGFPGGLTPAPLPTGHAGGTGVFQPCTTCHSHAQEFVVPNSDCLGGGGGAACHAPIGTAIAPLAQPFYGLTTAYVGSANLMSQHNIRYQEDRNFATVEDASVNECKKCHPKGTSHPKNTAFLESPMGTIYPRMGTTGGYQSFCIACHDGVNAALPNNQFAGAIPAHQAVPDDRSYAPNTGVAPWRVPYVPQRVVAGCDSQASWVRPPTPYLTTFYERTGHGAALSMRNAVMDLTCLSISTFTPDGSAGCHNAHSATNRMLVAETITAGATDWKSIQDFQVGPTKPPGGVCLNAACHDSDTLAFVGGSNFHGGWSGRGGMSHTDPLTTSGGVVVLQAWTDNMTINGIWTTSGVLPFWTIPTTRLIEDRVYSKALDTNQVACLTCHDPHGTASVRQEYKESTAPPAGVCNTQAMLRKFPKTWTYGDPLCGECHHE